MLMPFDNQGKEIQVINELKIEEVPRGVVTKYWLHLATDGMGVPIRLPIIVARGFSDGKTLGLTAAVHGNELNGISVITRTFKEIDATKIRGTIVGVPVVNVPSLLRKKRRFIDGTDLNHIMPGKEDGNVSQVYAWRFVNKVVKEFDYLIDLHTASFGRVNSYYIRADMSQEITKKLSLLQNPQIIVHNPPNDGTLRGTADEMGIPAITLEVGNPNTFQKGMIRDGLEGIRNALSFLGITDTEVQEPDEEIILCNNSYWIYTDTGGLLTVYPKVAEMVKKGQEVATLRDIFGDLIKSYYAPEDGVVIGKSVSPLNWTGGRILHLGILK